MRSTDVSERSSAHRFAVLATTVSLSASCLLLTACSEDTVEGEWDIDETITVGVERLHGPLEMPGDYLGRIGGDLYFAGHDVPPRSVYNPVTVYTADAQWRRAADDFAQALGNRGWREQIVEIDGEFFYLNEIDATLYRTEDAGQTWQALPDAPQVGGGRMLGDGEHLYALALPSDGPTDAGVLWRSDDRGEAWQPILDGVAIGSVRATPGLLVAAAVDESDYVEHLMRSTDAGETWEDLGSRFDLGNHWARLGDNQWVEFDGVWVTPPLKPSYDMDGHLGVVNDEGLVDYRPLAGLAETDSLDGLTACGGELYATATEDFETREDPYGTRLGRVDMVAKSWEELELPDGTYLPFRAKDGGLHCVGNESLVLITDAGAWRSDDGAQTWQQTGSPFSTPSYLFRSDGDLYSGQTFSPTWKKAQGQSDWQHTTAFRELSDGLYEVGLEGVRDVQQNDGRLFVTIETEVGAAVYRMSEPQAEAEEIWTVQHSMFGKVDVHVDAAHIAIAQHGVAGGLGLFVSHDGGDSIEAVALPATDYAGSAPDSVAFFDGRIWLAMPGFDLWSKPFGEGEWRREERGLPETYRPDELRVAHGRLLAFSSRQVYRRVDGGWQGMLSSEIRQALELAEPGAAGNLDAPHINDVTFFGGVMVIATDTKIALVRSDTSYDILDQTGGVELFDLGTELYAAAANGGLVRLAHN